MSGLIMGQVWSLDLPQSEKLVLLAMADHADHTGGNVFPSVGLIAWKTDYSERHVRRTIKSLRDRNILVPQKEEPGKTVIYKIDIKSGKQKPEYGCKILDFDADVTPDIIASPPPLTPVSATPDIAMSPKPSRNRQKEPSRKPQSGALPLPNITIPEPNPEMTTVWERYKSRLEPIISKKAVDDLREYVQEFGGDITCRLIEATRILGGRSRTSLKTVVDAYREKPNMDLLREANRITQEQANGKVKINYFVSVLRNLEDEPDSPPYTLVFESESGDVA